MTACPDANSNDRELLVRLRRGDPAAAAVLVARLEPLLNRMLFRLTGWQNETQDLVQDVFLAIQQSAESFRGDSSLETWATAIAIHRCRRWQREEILRHEELQPAAIESIVDRTPQQRAASELQEEVQLVLRRLKHDLREVVVLRYLEDHSLEEISRLLGIRKNTVEVRLHRARQELGILLAPRLTMEQETR